MTLGIMTHGFISMLSNIVKLTEDQEKITHVVEDSLSSLNTTAWR